jgi:small subunit ribosomal protein S6
MFSGVSLTCIFGSITAKGRKVALNQYETIFIIEPDLESEGVESIIEDVQNLISGSGGVVAKVDRWGKKRLAYEVKGHRDGNYVLINFQADPQFIQRLGRYYGLTEQIIKNMTVRAEDLLETKGRSAEDEEFSYGDSEEDE